MKLVDKFTLWFIAVILLTTPITAYYCYYNLEKHIEDTEIARLKGINEEVAAGLRKGQQPDNRVSSTVTTARELSALPASKSNVQVEADPVHHESRMTVRSYYQVNGKNYEVASANYVPAHEEIAGVILKTVFWKLLLLVACMVITARLVSQWILSSFKQTMKLIQSFHVKKKVEFVQSSTREFRELNTFLQKMTDRIVDEYAAVKEFSENASHELQTPLAVLRNKLELLSETNIEECQAALIEDMQNAVEKLSKINRLLILLAKLENNEYTATENIRFCRVAKDVLAMYEDRIEIKHLMVTKDIDKNILLRIHPVLADMLMNNLIGNAIRHNVPHGMIDIQLTQRKLIIKNTGMPPAFPAEELFLRFKKGNQCSDSVGLGLAIVKQICEVCDFNITYHYENNLHVIQVDFQGKLHREISRAPALEAI
ncbi:sensor histidine kinase [Chitinophaga vietnamensis]|uniref:sensor histidine kinase n=1 Tax=Chitinophaga vietnamensis TaxID=2593957 RepID=UPI00117757E4|nr:HAMP domain-containing sensor histidine kinase [Chitinophaga vietnamensis]